MPDQHKNFAASLVATAPSPAASGTSLVVTATEGTLFPTVPFNATVWPVSSQPTAANAEIVRVTNITGDTFTITRTQEGSSARSIIVGDQIAATVTALTLTDVEYRPFANAISPAQLTADTDNWNPTGLSTATVIKMSMDAEHNLTGIQGGTEGRVLILENTGSFSILLVHDSTSTAANRFWLGAGAGGVVRLFTAQSCMFVYDAVASRWKLLSIGMKGGAAPLIAGTAAAGTSRWFSSEDHVHPSEGVASTGYTPTLTQSGAVTKTVTFARYIQIGKLVHVWFELAVTGSGTTANAIRVGLPATASTSAGYIGSGELQDSSVQSYPGLWSLATTTTVEFFRTDVALDGPLGVSPAFALANTDSISGYLMYEAA